MCQAGVGRSDVLRQVAATGLGERLAHPPWERSWSPRADACGRFLSVIPRAEQKENTVHKGGPGRIQPRTGRNGRRRPGFSRTALVCQTHLG